MKIDVDFSIISVIFLTMKTILLKTFNIRHENFSIDGTCGNLTLASWNSNIPLNQLNDLKQKDLKTLIELLTKTLEVCEKEHTIKDLLEENS